jgi:endonuclease-3 related protein
MIDSSFDLLLKLKNIGYIKEEVDPYWWPNSGTFESLIGAILTQNTKWTNVEKSLKNLKDLGIDNIEAILNLDKEIITTAIKPSGFYNTKYKYIYNLCKNIKKEYNSFENFQENISREWLIRQKGIGDESCDAIMCYVCYKDEMVVDSYTHRLVSALGYEFENYHDLKDWCKCGINDNFDKISAIYNKNITLNYIYARFHGKIVDYCKDYSNKKNIDITLLR